MHRVGKQHQLQAVLAMRSYPCFSRSAGFTLIELMTTIAIAAVLMMIAAPSFVSFQRNSELTSLTNTLLAAINATRGAAMKEGTFAMAVPKDGSDWNSGWVVFVDKDLDQSFDAAKDEVILQQSAPSSYITISGSGTATGASPYILYNASGYSRQKNGGFGALTLSIVRNDVASAQAADQTRRIVVASSGRTRSCRPSTDTTCTASATE